MTSNVNDELGRANVTTGGAGTATLVRAAVSLDSALDELRVPAASAMQRSRSAPQSSQVALLTARLGRETFARVIIPSYGIHASDDVQLVQEPARNSDLTTLLANLPRYTVIGLVNGGKNDCWANSILQLIFRASPVRDAVLSVPNYGEFRTLCRRYHGLERREPDSQDLRLMLHREHPGGMISAEPVYQDASEALSLMLSLVPSDRANALFPRYTEIKEYAPTGRTQPVGDPLERSRLNAEACTVRLAPGDPQVFLDIPRVVDSRDPLRRVALSEADFGPMLEQAFDNTQVAADSTAWFLGEDPELLYEHSPVRTRITYREKPTHLIVTLRRFHYDVASQRMLRDSTLVQIPRVLDLPERATPFVLDRRLVLRAFVVHTGAHYISYVNNEGQWFRIDDAKAKEVTLEEVDRALCRSYIHYFEQGNADAEPPLVRVEAPPQLEVRPLAHLNELREACKDDKIANDRLLAIFEKLPKPIRDRLLYKVWIAHGCDVKSSGRKILEKDVRALVKNQANIDLLKELVTPVKGELKPASSQLNILLTLGEMLEKRDGNQEQWLKLFSQLDRRWQYRAMHWVWMARNRPQQAEFGKNTILSSARCLLDRVGRDPQAKRVIDYVIDEVLLDARKTEVLSSPVARDVSAEARKPKKSDAGKKAVSTGAYGIRRLLACEEAILQMETPSSFISRRVVVKPIPKDTVISRVTDIRTDVAKHSSDGLTSEVRRVIDADVVKYLSNPWAYITREAFQGRPPHEEEQYNEAAVDVLKAKKFTAINYKVIEHEELPGWVFKGNTSQVSHIRNAAGDTGNNRYDHLNRVRMNRVIKEAIEEEGLLIDVPETYLIDSGVASDDPEERYLVVQKKLPILSHEEMIAVFTKMPSEQQQLYAEHLCRLVIKTGYSDAHFGNITLLDGKLYIYDEEPMGVLRNQSDAAPNFDKPFEAHVAVGLQRIVDTIGAELPVFRVVAGKALSELRERAIDMPEHRLAFHQFVRAMQDPQATTEDRVAQFNQLNPQFRAFLGKVVATGLGRLEDAAYGEKRILEQPEILTLLSNRGGVDILRQIGVRFEVQSAIETLTLLKEQLLLETPSPERLGQLLKQLNTVFGGEIIFNPLQQKIMQVIEAVNKGMPDAAYEEVFNEVCRRLLQSHTPGSQQCFLDDLIGMLQVVKQDFSLASMSWRLTRNYDSRYGAASDPTPSRPVMKDLVRVSSSPREHVERKLSVLIVAYECAAYGLKFGGLGEAIYGMAKGLAARGHKVTLLTPKFDKLPPAVAQRLVKTEEVAHRVLGSMKRDNVYGFEQDGISFRYLEDTRESADAVDHYSVPDAKQIYVDGPLARPDAPWVGLKERMLYFTNAATAYADQHRGDIDIVAPQDWHGGGILWKIATESAEEWNHGRTPATVFVIHNGNYQGDYGSDTIDVLRMFGDQRPGMNVMLDAMSVADQVVTVSPSYAMEMQERTLGAGIDQWMRRLAYNEKLTGIANGSNPDLWNPADNEALKNWVDPVTGEPVPLTYSADDADILAKKALIKEQLQKALEVHYPEAVKRFRLNVRDNDLVLYVGRYDSSQKGLERFSTMMRAAHERGAAFVTMGIGEDPHAIELLDALEAEAEEIGNAWITRGQADGFSIKMQLGDKVRGIPPLGSLFRAAAIYSIAPSNFEPCGLVQFEAWLFGTLVVATATGGLADTIVSDPSDPDFNGFTFERLASWDSSKQDDLAHEAVLTAIDHWRGLSDDGKVAIMQRIMRSARLSSWTTAPKGLSPVEQYEVVFQKAIEHAQQRRGLKKVDLIGSDEAPPVTKDNHFGKGFQPRLYETYGAHIVRDDDGEVRGVNFRVMAINAEQVNLVIKDDIEERIIPMKALGKGVWEILVEGAAEGTVYEYEMVDASGKAIRKIDPFAFGSQLRPLHASVVRELGAFNWTDDAWQVERAANVDEERPLNIYEMHLGSWRRNPDGSFMNYREIAEHLAVYLKRMNYTHVELMGLLEHPTDASWGYQVSGFFAPTSRHGTLEDFQYMVNHLHESGLGVIIDFVPYHFAPDDWGLRDFGGVKLFENSDPYNGESMGWGTRVFDLEREDVRNFLVSSAHFFLSNHIDGLRVDAVSEQVTHMKYGSDKWKPNKDGSHWNQGGIEFLRTLNTMSQTQFPGVLTFAENSRTLPMTKVDTDSVDMDGLAFDRRWNMGWMSTSLKFLKAAPDQRMRQFQSLIASFDHHWQMRNVSAISHDEVVHGKGSLYGKAHGSPTEKLAQVRVHHAFQTLFPGEGILTFMGNEMAQIIEWNEGKEIQWGVLEDAGHRGVWELSRALNAFYLDNRPLWGVGTAMNHFEWITVHPKNLVLSYHRRDSQGRQLAIVFNFSDRHFNQYRLTFRNREAVERLKGMKVVFNTDHAQFGGSGKSDGQREATVVYSKADKKPEGFSLQLPGYSAVVIEEEFSDSEGSEVSV